MTDIAISAFPAAAAIADTDLVPVVEIGTPNVTKRGTAAQMRAPLLPLAGGTLTGALTIASGGLTVTGASQFNTTVTMNAIGGWSSSNAGKQLLLTTPAGTSNPAIGLTDSNGTNLWGLWNNAGTLNLSAMPAYSDSATGPTTVLAATKTGVSVTGTLTSSGKLTVTAGGATVTAGGLTVTAGGATVTAGGLTVSAGGAAVTGNSLVTGSLSTTSNIIMPNNVALTMRDSGNTIRNVLYIDGSNNVRLVNGGGAVIALSNQAGSTLVTCSEAGAVTMSAGQDFINTDGVQSSKIRSIGSIALDKTDPAGFFIVFSNSGVTIGSVQGNGAGGTLYNTTSDARLKLDDGPLGDVGSIIDRLKPLWFRWKRDENGSPQPGFFAQQVAKVFPWAVTKGKGRPGSKSFEPWQLDHGKFMPLVIAELQALRRRVRELERRT